MSDFAQPNHEPGRCVKCSGSGIYSWKKQDAHGTFTVGGPCHSCGGTGAQTRADIARNNAYNRFKLQNLEGV
jgi:DnaJ-class molecular chaperone